MAEIVDYRVGKTLKEINDLIKLGLFSEAQASEIIKKREDFEYSLRRRTKCTLKYLEFIRFEMRLLFAIEGYKTKIGKDKEDKLMQLQAKKLDEIVRSRVGHICFLYRKVIFKNQFDKRIWLAYIEFAKQRKLFNRVSSLYWRMLRVVNDDESLWLDAADFEISVTKDVNTALKLLLLGSRHNPNSKSLKERMQTLCPSVQLEQVPTKEPETVSVTKTRASSKQKTRMDILYECYNSDGIEKTRELYRKLDSNLKDQTLSLYVGMIQIETWQLKRDKSETQLNLIRNIYDRALIKFGHRKAKLWYEYIQFEHKFAKQLEDLDRINRVYTRALAALDASKVDRVIEKYNLLQTRQGRQIDVDYSDYSELED